MDLWIRSQDRKKLVKVVNLTIFLSDTNWFIYTENNVGEPIEIGKYKTKERALEILDEIQSILRPKIKYTQNIKEDMKPEYTYKHFVSESSDIEVIQLNTYVYEMPKE